MNETDTKLPEHQAIYLQIRNMILFGSLVPGQAVTIQGLTDATGAGMTPVREAIRRLSAEGALEARGNRRVRVPELSLRDLEHISLVRLSVEPRLAALAADHMSEGCLDALQAYDAGVDAAIDSGNVESYLEHNYSFHFCLYDQADAQILNKIAAALWLRIGPSLRIVCGRYGTANLPDMHSEALSALRRSDGQAVARAIADDIRQGIDQVRLSLSE